MMAYAPFVSNIRRSQPLAVGPPSRRPEHHSGRLAPRARGEDIAHDGGPLVKCDANRIEGPDILHDAVAGRLLLALLGEGAEHPVPHHEHTGVVAVEVAWVRGVMHPVMRRRIEQVLEPARHALDRFRVNPELIEQVESLFGEDHGGRKAEKGERYPRNPGADDDAGPGL